MAFIRRKRTSAGTVYQVIRTRRDDGRVRQEHVLSLGYVQTITAALASARGQLATLERLPGHSDWTERTAAECRARIDRLEQVQAETGLA